jgi:N-dimethylarginine dimethylaminohydrolase
VGKAFILNMRRNEKHRPGVRLYEKQWDGSYAYVEPQSRDFITFMQKKEYEINNVMYLQKSNFTVNILCTGHNNIIAVKGLYKGYEKTFRNNGVKAELVEFPNLLNAYGGPHCLTQALRRENGHG